LKYVITKRSLQWAMVASVLLMPTCTASYIWQTNWQLKKICRC
tara:strand:- start:36227 stop:36355 length:129 start_codon:yes stop_codon:yes gene_type:complete